MSHLVEEYAKNLGVKISQPIVKDHFFPILFEKYITLSADGSVQSKNYPHYDIVIKLLKPFLDNAGIKIIQLGGLSRLEGTDAALNLSFKQQSFVISKSLVHLGSDGALSQLASSKKVPTVNIFGNTLPQANRPIFSQAALNTNLTPEWDKKPSFGPVDPNYQIKNIKAEVVAQSVLDFLDIEKEKINFTTKHIGNSFSQPALEVIPTEFCELRVPEGQPVILRLDYCDVSDSDLEFTKSNKPSEDAILKYAERHATVITTKFLIQPEIVRKISKNLKSIFLQLDCSFDPIPDTYLQLLKNLNIEIVLLVTKKEDLTTIRNKYFDIPVRPFYNDKEAPCEIKESTRFMSSMRLIENGKEYLSYAHWKKGLDNDNKVINNPDYWKELDNFYIYDTD